MTFKPMIAATLASALAFATPLAAQENTAEPKSLSQVEPNADMAAEDVTETQVSAFVDALVAIEQVRVAYVPQIEAASDAEARNALIDQANAAVVEAIDGVENMDVSEYMAIDKVAQEDEDLNARIMAEIAELRKNVDGETSTQ